MKGPQFKVTLFVLPRQGYTGPPLRVPLRPYLAFVGRLEEQLGQLEARWARPVPQTPVARFFAHRPH